MQLDVLKDHARDREHARVLAQLNLRVEVPDDAEGPDADRPFLQGALPFDESLRTKHRHGSWRRDAKVLESISFNEQRNVEFLTFDYFPKQPRHPLRCRYAKQSENEAL